MTLRKNNTYIFVGGSGTDCDGLPATTVCPDTTTIGSAGGGHPPPGPGSGGNGQPTEPPSPGCTWEFNVPSPYCSRFDEDSPIDPQTGQQECLEWSMGSLWTEVCP